MTGNIIVQVVGAVEKVLREELSRDQLDRVVATVEDFEDDVNQLLHAAIHFVSDDDIRARRKDYAEYQREALGATLKEFTTKWSR